MSSLTYALLESDRLYFELGAIVEPIPGAGLAWMPGLETTPGAAVVHRTRPREAGADPGRWVAMVTDRLTALGCSTARIYLDDDAPGLEGALAAAGFQSRVEIGYLAGGELPRGRPDVALRPILGDADWEAKRKVHASSEVAADGHRSSPDSWVELERRKCAGGGLSAFLIEVDGEVCGGVATLEAGELLRAKNIFVHPDRQREGIGAQAMHLLSRRARELSMRATGIFGVDGRPGNALYRHLGMTPAVRQYEWARSLP